MLCTSVDHRDNWYVWRYGCCRLIWCANILGAGDVGSFGAFAGNADRRAGDQCFEQSMEGAGSAVSSQKHPLTPHTARTCQAKLLLYVHVKAARSCQN